MQFDATILGVLVILLIGVAGWLFIIGQNTRRTHEVVHNIAGQQSLIRADERVRNLCRAVHLLHPGVHAGTDYLVRHDDKDSEPYIAEWHATAAQPTREELDAALAKLANIDSIRNYAGMRKAEYPSVGDQLDAAYKARQGHPEEQEALDGKITLIKEKYPKSEECY